jgi:hypothetical protein
MEDAPPPRTHRSIHLPSQSDPSSPSLDGRHQSCRRQPRGATGCPGKARGTWSSCVPVCSAARGVALEPRTGIELKALDAGSRRAGSSHGACLGRPASPLPVDICSSTVQLGARGEVVESVGASPIFPLWLSGSKTSTRMMPRSDGTHGSVRPERSGAEPSSRACPQSPIRDRAAEGRGLDAAWPGCSA